MPKVQFVGNAFAGVVFEGKQMKAGQESGIPDLPVACAFVPDYRTFLNDFAKIIDFLDWYADKK